MLERYYHYDNLDRLLMSETLLHSIYMSHISFARSRGAKSRIIYNRILETETFQERFDRIMQNLNSFQYKKF